LIGSGNWGSTISKIIGTNVQKYPHIFNQTVNMWVFDEPVVLKNNQDTSMPLTEYINTYHENIKYLPGIKLPENVLAIPKLEIAVSGCTLLIFVLPHEYVTSTCDKIAPIIAKKTRCISLIKGIDFSTKSQGFQSTSELIRLKLNTDVAVLMGANIAEEVARGEFTEATIGCRIKENGKLWKTLFHTDNFCIRVIPDVAGPELYGALKNIVAIAVGLMDGLGLGVNTKAAVIRIGINEMREFLKIIHEEYIEETVFESCGVADLIATCIGGRNRRVAEAMVKTGKSVSELELELLNGQKLQGPPAAYETYLILKRLGRLSDFPLFSSVYSVCFEGLAPKILLRNLIGFDQQTASL